MSVDFPNAIERQVATLGKGYILAGSFTEEGGLQVIGPTEGDITVALNPTYDTLTFPELSGEAIVERRIKGFNPVITAPLLLGYASAYEILFSETDISIAVISELEFKDGLEFKADDWVTPVGGPKHALWLSRARFTTPNPTFGDSNIGKRTFSVEIQGLADYDLAWAPEEGVFDRHFIWGDPKGKIAGLVI